MNRHSYQIGKASETSYLGGDITVDKDGLYTYLFGGGYCEFKPCAAYADSIKYYYYTKDHLGNVRNVISKNASGTMEGLQQTHYYPFGGIIADLSTGRNVQNHLYNGKELDYSNNLWWYDYGARQYDPTRGQFTTPDPLAEMAYDFHSFAYCHNNPIAMIDPTGMFATYFDALDYADAHHAGFNNVYYSNDRKEWYVAYGENGRGYVSGGTLERRFEEQITETDAWRSASLYNTEFSIATGWSETKLEKELGKSLSYVFYNMKGQHLSSFKPTVKFKNYSYEFNAKTISKIAKGAKYLGRGAAGISALMIANEIRQEKKNIIGEGGIDLIMTGVGLAPGYGWVISGSYFLGKYILEENNLDFWNK